MKTLRSFLALSLLSAALTAGFAQSNLDVTLLGDTSNSVLLSENFSGTTLDVANWTTNLPYADSAVAVAGAACTATNRGYVNSVDSFTGDLEINFMVKLHGDRTSGDFYWKTTGTIMGADRSCVVDNGLNVTFWTESQLLFISNRKSWEGVECSGFIPTNLPLETWISVRIVDQNNTVSVYLNGDTTPTATLTYTPSILVAGAGKISLSSRESQYCGSVGASFTALSVKSLTPPPTEMIVTVTEPVSLAAIVVPEVVSEPVMMMAAPAADVVPTVTVTDAATGVVVATDVVLTGDTTTDSKHFSNRHRKAYGVNIARHNRLKGAHCATTKKLPAGIYVFSFQQKSGAKNCKFNATIVRIDDEVEAKSCGKNDSKNDDKGKSCGKGK